MLGGAAAQAIVSTGESFVRASLAAGARRADGAREAGLVLDVAPGWKTYWRNPGEAGIPPRFDWSRSENVADVEIDWPRPVSFESFGMTTLGYAGRVVLPIVVHPVDAAKPVALDLGIALGVCDEICVLEETRAGLTIAPDEAGADAAMIADARGRVPASGASQGLTQASCRITGAGTDRRFEARLAFDRPLSAPMVVLEGPENTWFHDTETTASDGAIEVSATLSLLDPAAWVERRDLRITVLAEGMAADIRGCGATG